MPCIRITWGSFLLKYRFLSVPPWIIKSELIGGRRQETVSNPKCVLHMFSLRVNAGHCRVRGKELTLNSGVSEVSWKVYEKGRPCLKGRGVHNPNVSMVQEGNLHKWRRLQRDKAAWVGCACLRERQPFSSNQGLHTEIPMLTHPIFQARLVIWTFICTLLIYKCW